MANKLSPTGCDGQISYIEVKERKREWEWEKVPFSATKGSDQVKTFIKLGNQYGWGEWLNWRMFITVFSYRITAL
jgi:hypothetical protein